MEGNPLTPFPILYQAVGWKRSCQLRIQAVEWTGVNARKKTILQAKLDVRYWR